MVDVKPEKISAALAPHLPNSHVGKERFDKEETFCDRLV
jgi:hypothetical protein